MAASITNDQVCLEERLASIAERHWGKASRERGIVEANRDRMNGPDPIFPGQQVFIPPR